MRLRGPSEQGVLAVGALLDWRLLGPDGGWHVGQGLDESTLVVPRLVLVQALAVVANHIGATGRLVEDAADPVGIVGGGSLEHAAAGGANLAGVLALGLDHLAGRHTAALDLPPVDPAGAGPVQSGAIRLGQQMTGGVVQVS